MVVRGWGQSTDINSMDYAVVDSWMISRGWTLGILWMDDVAPRASSSVFWGWVNSNMVAICARSIKTLVDISTGVSCLVRVVAKNQLRWSATLTHNYKGPGLPPL